MRTLLPSAAWIRFLPALWRFLSPRERWLELSALILPLVQQFATMGSFLVTMRIVMKAIRGSMSSHHAILGGLAIFGAFGLAALVQWLGSRVDEQLKVLNTRLARRMMVGQLLYVARLPEEDRAEVRDQLAGLEGEFIKNTSQALLNLTTMASSLLLVSVLALVLLLIAPLIGGVLILFGVFLLVLVRHRVRKPFKESEKETKLAKKELLDLGRQISELEDRDNALASEYENNNFDQLQTRLSKWKKQRTDKVGALVGIVSALLMGLLFVLAVEGYFSHLEPTSILIIVLATRLSVAQGKGVLTRWSSLMENRAIVISMHNQLVNRAPDYVKTMKLRKKKEKQLDVVS